MQTWTWSDWRAEHLPAVGPWTGEPDKAHWVDEATGLDCLIVRNYYGELCGYVGVPKGHPWFGESQDAVGATVHGGELSFAGPCDEGAEPGGQAVCHMPEPGRPEPVWWLGFDCGHVRDVSPALRRRADGTLDTRYQVPDAVYRTFAYVRGEVTELARQAAAAAGAEGG